MKILSGVELDASLMSKEQATLDFQDRVNQLGKEQNLDLVEAWARGRALWPDIYLKAFSADERPGPSTVRPVGSFADGVQLVPPPASAQLSGAPAKATGGADRLRSAAATLMPKRPTAIPNQAAVEAAHTASREAHEASSAAGGAKSSEASAVFAHFLARIDNEAIGDAEAAQMHQGMVRYHAGRYKRAAQNA